MEDKEKSIKYLQSRCKHQDELIQDLMNQNKELKEKLEKRKRLKVVGYLSQ